MTGWRTLHATVAQPDELPSAADIEAFINERTDRSHRVWQHGDRLKIYKSGRDSDPLFKWAERHADALETVGFGRGNDTGPGPDTVTFYKADDGELEKAGQSRRCPVAKDGLRIEATR